MCHVKTHIKHKLYLANGIIHVKYGYTNASLHYSLYN